MEALDDLTREFTVRINLAASCFLTGALLMGASCNHGASSVPPAQPPAAPAAKSDSPLKHWVQSQRLKSVMDQISKLHSSVPRGLPDDVESTSGREASLAAASAATAADDLAQTALRIPGVLEGRTLSEADRSGFLAEAHTLHDQAIRLRDAAQKFQIEPMQQALDQITSTCLSCHSRYRDLSGELDFRKAFAPRPDSTPVAAIVR